MKTLFSIRGFTPLLCLIFLNAFIDLGHKITIQNTVFKLYDGQEQIILTAIINSFILLPYIAFFAPAGRLSDIMSKAKVLRITSFAAFAIMLLIALCYYFAYFWAAFFLTLLLALQSAFYGPAKLGYLKELMPNTQLKAANGFVQSLLMLAILSGILVFSALFETLFHDALSTPEQVIKTMTPLALLLSFFAAIEALLSFTLPQTQAPKANKQTVKVKLSKDKDLIAVVSGLCVFWAVGQMLLAVYPAFAKEYLLIDNAMLVQAILASMAIGIMAGSLLDGLLSRHYIVIKYLPIAAAIVMVSSLLLPFIHSALWASILFLCLGFAGGMVIVPLNALLQFFSPANALGSVIAKANLIQNIAMLACLVLTMFLSSLYLPSWMILLLIALVSFIGLSAMLINMPQSLYALRLPSQQVKGFNYIVGSGLVIFKSNDDLDLIEEKLKACYPRRISRQLNEQTVKHCAYLLPTPVETCCDTAHVYYVHLQDEQLVFTLTMPD